MTFKSSGFWKFSTFTMSYINQRVKNKGIDQTANGVQAGLGLCCSHATKSGFLAIMPEYGHRIHYDKKYIDTCTYHLQF